MNMSRKKKKTLGGKKNKSSINKKKKFQQITPNNNHCSPHSLKNGIVSGSCFTKDAIDKITHAHNSHNPERIIPDHLSPKDKWLKLRENMSRIPKCDQDKCWLENIKLSDREKSLLKAQLFVPPRPRDWNKLPNTWLTNFDIANVLKQYEKSHPEFQFIGPSPIDYDTKPNKTKCVCDKLCNFSVEKQIQQGKRKIGIVFNLDPHDKGGSHWVAKFIDLDDKFVFYFNSTGERIQPELKRFKNMVLEQGTHHLGEMDYYANTYEHQKSNTECGMYCLYFIITCLLREPDIFKAEDVQQPKLTKTELVAHFAGKQRIPDKLVEEYRQEMFR
jgi:hypothetical protein